MQSPMMRSSSIVAKRPGFLALSMVLAVTPCHGHGGFHEEIARCNERIAAEPGNAEHWFQRGRLDCLHGDWMRALMDLDTVERLAPGKYPVDLVRSQAWLAGGKLPQAKTALDAFVEAQPEVAEGFVTRARLMVRLEQADAAAADFQKGLAITESPEPDLYVETADALVMAKCPEKAVRTLDAGMVKLGVIASLAEKALALERSLGHYEAALSRIAVMQQAAPRPEPWMAKRADVLAQAGRRDEARLAWEELRGHLLALPDQERNSRSMSGLLEQCQQALAVPRPSP